MFEKLEWQLIAKDEASATFDKVKQSQDKLAESSERASQATTKTASGWKNIATGVFAGGVALNVAQKALGFLQTQLTSCVKEAQDFERVQTQLSAALISTGGASGETLDDLNKMAKELSNITAVDDDVINSMQAMQLTFTNITKPIFKEVSLAAIDMATAMNGGVLPSAEQLQSQMIQLGKAIQDPTVGINALTRVGVNFTSQQKDTIKTLVDTGKTMEAQQMILAELNKEFGGRAAAAANTYEGQMTRLSNAVGDVKKQIGQALLPTLTMLTSNVADSTGNVEISKEKMRDWQLRIYQVGVIIKGVVLTIGNFIGAIASMTVLAGKAIASNISFFIEFGKAIMNFGQHAKVVFEAVKKAMTGDFGGALDTLKNDFKNTFSVTTIATEEFAKQAKKTIIDLSNSFDPMEKAIQDATNPKAFNQLIDKMSETENRAKTAASGIAAPLSDLSDSAQGSADKVKSSIESISQKYNDVMGNGGKIGESLAKLEEDHTSTIQAITDKLKDLKTQLADAEAAYKNTVAEMNKGEAERVVEQEQKIADLRKQIQEAQSSGGGGDNSRITELSNQLSKEQAAYDAYMASRKGLETELAEARRRAGETDFQRFIEDLTAKRTLAESDHKTKVDQLNAEILQQQEQARQETVIYEGKKAQYLEVQKSFQDFHDKYLGNLSSMKNATQKSVDDMNKKLQEMVSVLAQIESAKNKAGLLQASGEAGANSAMMPPSGNQNASGTAVAAASNNNTITINLGGVTVGNQAQINDLVNTLKRQLQLAGIASQ